ncbi:hypothetical protein MHYP_G00330750 [Metynnis hypsauchen]
MKLKSALIQFRNIAKLMCAQWSKYRSASYKDRTQRRWATDDRPVDTHRGDLEKNREASSHRHGDRIQLKLDHSG